MSTKAYNYEVGPYQHITYWTRPTSGEVFRVMKFEFLGIKYLLRPKLWTRALRLISQHITNWTMATLGEVFRVIKFKFLGIKYLVRPITMNSGLTNTLPTGLRRFQEEFSGWLNLSFWGIWNMYQNLYLWSRVLPTYYLLDYADFRRKYLLRPITMNSGLASNKPTHYLVDYVDFGRSFQGD